MKNVLGAVLRRFGLVGQMDKDHAAFEQLRKRLLPLPRNTPGRMEVLGWDLEYVDGLSLLFILDSLVFKRWNDFVPTTSEPIILDCGANIGVSVLHYKRQFPGAKITALEPDPHFVPILRRNLERNGASDVKIIEAAVWIKEGEEYFFCEGTDGSRLITQDRVLPASILVKTIDFRKFISCEIDLIKMDIEGAESDVVVHLGERLKLVKNIVIECHVDNGKIGPFARLLEVLAEKEFSVSLNSYGVWRDLIHQPEKGPYEFDSYILVAARRNY